MLNSKTNQRSGLFAIVMLALVCMAGPVKASTIVRLNMNIFLPEISSIDIQLFDDTPLTRDNFIKYVVGNDFGTSNTADDTGPLYDGAFFHRLVPGFVLQGGGFYTTQTDGSFDPVQYVPGSPNDNVPNEFGRSNLRGTLAMAKLGGDPDSATNQFFFNYEDNSGNLDNQNGGFTVFARVIGRGMELVDAYGTLGTIDVGGFTGIPVFNGTPISITTAEILDVVDGDANLDGVVNLADLAKLATNFGRVQSAIADDVTWTDGDFTGDGVVNLADLARLATNFGSGGGAGGGVSDGGMSLEEAVAAVNAMNGVAVPEPSTMGLLLIGSVAGLMRRRHSNG